MATDTDDLLCICAAEHGPGPQVQPDLTAPEGQEQSAAIGAIGDTEKVEPAEAEMVEVTVPVPMVPVQPTPEGRENSQENGKNGKNGKNGRVRIDPTKADCTDSKADKVQVQKRDRSTSVPKRVQILPPRPSSISAPSASSPPAARSRTSSAKERPRMATQLHIPVSARLSSRRARNANTAMEKSFSARELSRCLADVGRQDFFF